MKFSDFMFLTPSLAVYLLSFIYLRHDAQANVFAANLFSFSLAFFFFIVIRPLLVAVVRFISYRIGKLFRSK